jgi:hypothetical protein
MLLGILMELYLEATRCTCEVLACYGAPGIAICEGRPIIFGGTASFGRNRARLPAGSDVGGPLWLDA